jgi:hypothetical protein
VKPFSGILQGYTATEEAVSQLEAAFFFLKERPVNK